MILPDAPEHRGDLCEKQALPAKPEGIMTGCVRREMGPVLVLGFIPVINPIILQ
jgi:hypothetical protein